MRAEIQLQTLHALDAGESTAEPYLWPLFFCIDEAVFAAGLRAARHAGEISDADLTARGLDHASLDAIPAPEWFLAPGGAHGNLPPMKSGQTVQLDRSFGALLPPDRGVLHPEHGVLGCVVILWEEDLYPGHGKVEQTYAAFADATRRRVETAVRDSIKAQAGGHGRFEFGLPAPTFGARLDPGAAGKVDYVGLGTTRVPELVRVGRLPEATLDPVSLEAELTSRYKDRWSLPLMDCDDFVGAMFWAKTVGELQAGGPESVTKHWTPTTGSQEGSWELQLRAAVG
jgi:hypothetical protein